jgi:hypothetical protein
MFGNKKIAGSEEEKGDEKKEFRPFERGKGRKGKRGNRKSGRK